MGAKLKTFTTKTGYGYFQDNQKRIISRFACNPGKHPIKKGFMAVDVSGKKAMEQIQVYIPPLSGAQLREQKIQAEIRASAIKALELRGEL